MERQRTRALILLADDSPTQTQRVMRALEAAGYRVQVAANGREALEQARRWQPDAIVSDILMPLMDGFALCREVRRDPALAPIPVVLQTSTFVDRKDAEFARAVGATRFILKPDDPAELVTLIRTTLAARATAGATPAEGTVDAEAFLKGYTERLVATLEQNIAELEKSNDRLERQNEELAAARDRLALLLEERERAAAALRISEARFRAASEGSLAGFFIFESVRDDAGHIVDFSLVDINARGEKLIGVPRDAVVGRRLGELLPETRVNGSFEKYVHVTETREALEEEIQVTLPGAMGAWMHHQIVPLADGVAVTALDITERKAFEEQLAHQAFHDPLTDLPNRALFMMRLGYALERVRSQRGAPGYTSAVLFLDMDRFKVVNDSLGHDAGDQLLIAVGERLQGCLRATDLVARFDPPLTALSTLARLGGDEFGILLEDIRDVNGAVHVAERITQEMRASFTVQGHELFISTSIGVALVTAEHRRPEAVLVEADVAMYRAKNKGKARYEVFDPSMNARALERLELETDLRRALDRGELQVHYQPKVRLETGRIVGAEALVRWDRPGHGLVSPAEFVSLAEETGLILPIGERVLVEACRQLHAWQAAYACDPPLLIAVNLSARQFQQAGLVDLIAGVLRDTALDPSSLLLEITESVAMQDAEASIATLHALRAQGVRLAIDDFGTGYSSLAYLKRFPVDTLKIDRTFVGGLGADIGDAAIVRAAITLAHTLEMHVTAEGVETAAQHDELRALGCDLGQGYYYAKPLTAEAASALLAEQYGRGVEQSRPQEEAREQESRAACL